MLTAEQRGWELHDYQVVALRYLQGRGRAALFLDMGLGKTAASLRALTPEHLPCLVVAPKKVAEETWPTEAALWRPDLRIRVAAGNATKDRTAAQLRQAALADNDADIVVVSRDNLEDALAVKRTRKFRTFIIDELSGYKNRASTRYRVAKAISKRASVKYVWGLSGTPAPNGLLDLWAPMYLLDNGERLGRTIGPYREEHFTAGRRLPNGVVTRYDLRPGHDQLIYAKIEDICLSMATEGRIVLPPTTFVDQEVELPTAIRAKYRELKDELVVDFRDIFGGELHSASNGGALTTKLSQLASGFLYDDPIDAEQPDGTYATVNAGAYTWVHDEKVDCIERIVEGTGSPILMAYRYQAERAQLLKRFPQASTIDEPGVVGAWNEGEVPILLAHPASAGHGLNLQHGGHTIVWSQPTWDLELWQQFNKRLSRQGQKNPVVIHVVMAKQTIDRLVRNRCDGKEHRQNALLDHLESPV